MFSRPLLQKSFAASRSYTLPSASFKKVAIPSARSMKIAIPRMFSSLSGKISISAPVFAAIKTTNTSRAFGKLQITYNAFLSGRNYKNYNNKKRRSSRKKKRKKKKIGNTIIFIFIFLSIFFLYHFRIQPKIIIIIILNEPKEMKEIFIFPAKIIITKKIIIFKKKSLICR